MYFPEKTYIVFSSKYYKELTLESDNYDFSSDEYRVVAITLDIANYRLFKPVRSDVPDDPPKNFMKIKFMNKAIHVVVSSR